MALEQYIPQIAFFIISIISVWVSILIFNGSKGYVKTIFSGVKFASKIEGFIVFVALFFILSVLEKILTPWIENLLKINLNHLVWIIIVTILISYFMYDYLYFKK
ncbi:MAG: hypothetical protein WC413_02655 [Candidatus Nanoarchaeia archaeon]